MSCCKITSVCLSFAAKCWRCFTNALMTLCHWAFSRQISKDVYAFVLWRYVAVQIWRVKELFVPGIVASTIKGHNRYNHISALRLTFKISTQANIKKIPKKPMHSVLRFVYRGPFLWLIRRRTEAWKQNRERYSRGKVEKKCCPVLPKCTQSMRRFFHKCDKSKIIPIKRAGSVETSILW